MPYLCHIHNGLYVNVPGKQGCQDKGCVAIKNSNPPKRIIFGAVPGGTTKASRQKDSSIKFNNDMHKYREAVRQGLNPDQVTAKAALTSEKIANGDKAQHDRYSRALA